AGGGRRDRVFDPSWLVRAMDAVKCVLIAGVKVQRARTHRIVRTAFDIVWKRAEPPLLTLGRRPSRPFFLAADRGHAGPCLTIFAYDRAIADRLASGQHVVNVASIGIHQDRAWRFLAVILNDLTLIGGWYPRLLIGWVGQLLLIACGEIGVRHWVQRCLHASAEQQSSQQRHGYPESESTRAAASGAEVGGAVQVSSVHFLLLTIDNRLLVGCTSSRKSGRSVADQLLGSVARFLSLGKLVTIEVE